MQKINLSQLRQRRLFISILSGGLILLALLLGRLFPAAAVRDFLMIAATLVAGSQIALQAWNSLRNRHASIELLVTIAATGALWIGEYWEAAAVTFLFVFGAYLEARTLSQTRRVLEGLLNLAPTIATVLRDGRQVEVMPYEVIAGETVLLKPGSKVPVDGEVTDGRSTVDESAITGEPMPADKEAGSPVFAGTVNQGGLLTVRATGVGADTTLARIIHRVEEAQDEKAPAQRFIERFARWYTPAIIVLSVGAYIVTRDIELALTLLVIGCPGALVISTPVSVVAGIGRAAKNGILIKGGEYLENAGKISAIAFDKTGTLTLGRPQVTDIIPLVSGIPAVDERIAEPVLAGASGTAAFAPSAPPVTSWSSSNGQHSRDEANLLAWAALAEAGSEHPLARAVLAALPQDARLPQASDFEAIPGMGIAAGYQGDRIAVGTPAFLQDLAVAVSPSANAEIERMRNDGKTVLPVALNGELIGLLAVSDPVRPTAAEMIRQLKQSGLKHIVMLTGDHPTTAAAVAAAVGITEVQAGLLPDQKLAAIRSLQEAGHTVAMAGDGINDAPALAAADISIAMGAAGSDLAIETAGIALMSDDLLKLPQAIRLSRQVTNNIRQNVAVALLTVTVLLAGVLAGQVHMASGMLIHEASVMAVILNAMRLSRARA